MHDQTQTTVRSVTPSGTPAAYAERPKRLALPWDSLDEQTRNRILFGVFVAFIMLYPLLDRALGIGRMGSMNPILIFTLLALGLNIVVGMAGLLDLGYAAFFAIGGYTVAFLTAPQSPLVQRGIEADFWVALVVSFVVAAIFGVILGAPTLRLRGDYLAIVTLAFGEIVPRAFLNLEGLTNGAKGMNPIGRPHFFQHELLASDQVPWYYLILAVTAFSIFVMVRLRDSRLGRAWVAMREDEVAAASMGINLVQTKLLAFALGASFSGFGGALYASMLQFIDPFQFDFSISIILLAMVILGGIGNIWGVMFGAIVLGWFNFILVDSAAHWLRGLSEALGQPWLAQIDVANSKLMVFGLALVLMMLIRPEGIFPSAQRKAELTHARRGTLAAGPEPVITE
ncbi:MAG: branched-chain amino acid ABC transporter permease [Chloroflexota bacterium]|nr:branched-chain amino acid ABC transporter permease [Chloroflexota bacterium]